MSWQGECLGRSVPRWRYLPWSHQSPEVSLSLSCSIDTRSHSLLFVSVSFMRGRKWARRGVLEAPPLPWPDRQTDSLTADDFPSQYLSYLFGFDSSLHGFRVSFSCAHRERWSVDQKWWQEFWFSDSKWKYTITLQGDGEGGVLQEYPLGPKSQDIGGNSLPKRGK